jgi:hypothetical protein
MTSELKTIDASRLLEAIESAVRGFPRLVETL